MAARFQIDPERDPWDRQPGESDEAWEAFVTYRDMGLGTDAKRSIRRAARTLGKSETLVGRWSTNHEWARRSSSYDRHLDAVKLTEAADRVTKAARRHGEHIEALTMALIAPVQAYLRKIAEARQASQDPFAGWDMRDLQKAATEAARLMPNLVQAERLIMGLSTDKTEVVDERAAAAKRWQDSPREELEAFLLGADAGAQAERERLAAEEDARV